MSKETERLFKPGYIYVIMPEREMYIFSPNHFSAPKMNIHTAVKSSNEKYYSNEPEEEIESLGYIAALFMAYPGYFVKTVSPEVYSKNLKTIEAWLKSQESPTL